MKLKILTLVTILFASYLPAATTSSNVTDILSKYSNNPNGWSALNYAIEKKDYRAAIILLDYVRDFNKADGLNPLCRILCNALKSTSKKLTDEEHDLIEVLLQKGISLKWEEHYNQSCLYYALALKENDLVIKFLKKGANPQEGNGWTLFYAVQDSNYDMVKLLIEHGANDNQLGGGGKSLQHAVEHSNYEMVKLLIEHGVNFKHDLGKALQNAIEHSNDNMVNLLIEYGANTQGHPWTPLQYAIEHSNYNMVKLLIEHGTGIKELGSRSLHYAIDLSNDEMIKLLIEQGANDNQTGNRSLLYAIDHSNYELVQLLIDCGANAYSREKAIWIAISKNDVNIVRILLESGVNPNASNYNDINQSMLGLALRNPTDVASKEIVELLLQYGAKLP